MYKKRTLIVATLPLITLIAALTTVVKVEALSGSDFQAGKIIEDSAFFDPNTMSVSDIQNFLNAKVPHCDTNGDQPYGNTTRRSYSISKGYHPPYTCLKDFRQEVPSKNAENGLCNGISAGNKSAAEIIKEVSSSCGVNPQALITLIQKEQSLITDDWPWSIQYRSATGYGCPDTAPCDAEYYGFFNQVYSAARQFKRYVRDAHMFNYRAGRQNYILYNPNVACGGSNVYIHNNATAGLYNYTPYQPNQAALDNLYGSGDDCSAYGNRNFWRMYNDWFDTPQIPYSKSKWNFENLRGKHSILSTNDRIGRDPASVQYFNSLHIFSYNESRGTLEHTWEDGRGWKTETLDGAGGSRGRIRSNLGQHPTAIVYGTSLQVFYYDVDRGVLRHAWTDASGWKFEDLDGSIGSVSRTTGNIGLHPTATTYGNSLQLFYYDAGRGNLRHAWTDASGWKFEDLDGGIGSVSRKDGDVGLHPSAVVQDEVINVFYYDRFWGNLRHAYAGNHGWRFQNLEGDKGSISGYDSNIGLHPTATTYGNSLQLFYYDAGRGNLRHAWKVGSTWRFENLDGDNGAVSHHSANTGYYPEVITHNDDLYLVYYNESKQAAWLSWHDSSGWRFAAMDGIRDSLSTQRTPSGLTPTIAIYGSSIQVFYFDPWYGILRHAWTIP